MKQTKWILLLILSTTNNNIVSVSSVKEYFLARDLKRTHVTNNDGSCGRLLSNLSTT